MQNTRFLVAYIHPEAETVPHTIIRDLLQTKSPIVDMEDGISFVDLDVNADRLHSILQRVPESTDISLSFNPTDPFPTYVMQLR